MGIGAPVIDDRTYETLLGEILERIPVHSPEWTDFNDSDPGVTLVELFAFLADTVLWQIDERQRQRRRRRVAFLVVGTAGIGVFLCTWGRSASILSRAVRASATRSTAAPRLETRPQSSS
jgi:hypothetical protein